MDKNVDAFRTISEVARDLGVPQHVLRFWETKFPQIRPLKRGGGRRYYRRDEVALLQAVRSLLYDDGFTIKGVQRILKDQGVRSVAALADSSADRSALPRFKDALDGSASEELAAVESEGDGGAGDGALRRRLSDLAREIETCSAILHDARAEPRRV